MKKNTFSIVNIVIPLAGEGRSFIQAGYTLPKPLVDVVGKPIIHKVIENIKPRVPHKFTLICRKDHYERYSLAELFHKITGGNYNIIQVINLPQGAACTVLTAIDLINNDNELIIANADQIIDVSIDDFIQFARERRADGAIMTFEASHPKWSFVRLSKNGKVIETAEKKVISNHATAGIYYYKTGKIFVNAALAMIEKNIRFNNDFYVCPAFNEIILGGGEVLAWEIDPKRMHSVGSAEDLTKYLQLLDTLKIKNNGGMQKRLQNKKKKPSVRQVLHQ